jgi:hypothetical protein
LFLPQQINTSDQLKQDFAQLGSSFNLINTITKDEDLTEVQVNVFEALPQIYSHLVQDANLFLNLIRQQLLWKKYTLLTRDILQLMFTEFPTSSGIRKYLFYPALFQNMHTVKQE